MCSGGAQLSQDEEPFLTAIRANRTDRGLRLSYADWLEERGDTRGVFLRRQLALLSLPPDHPHRAAGEEELSLARKGIDPAWLRIVEPDSAAPSENLPLLKPHCSCFAAERRFYLRGRGDLADYQRRRRHVGDVEFHLEPQDTECDAWKRLLDLVEEAAADGRKTFAPGMSMDPREWARIVTLPLTIAKLKSVKRLDLYGSFLVRIPSEIGEMTQLKDFNPYTSWRLHWFPYEITRCWKLRHSTVSTRVLYGNFKLRPPFPRLSGYRPSAGDSASAAAKTRAGRRCSVCDRPFEDLGLFRVWISLWVGTDVLPLLVNACSEDCLGRLPRPADGYVQGLHRGGLDVQRPPAGR